MTNIITEVNVEETMREIRTGIQREQSQYIDIEKIMDEIRDQVKHMPLDEIPEFNPADFALDYIDIEAELKAGNLKVPDDRGLMQRMLNETQYVKENYPVSYYWDLGRGPKSFFKRAIRRMFRFILLPMIEKQNDFNMHTTNSIESLYGGTLYQQEQLNILFRAIKLQQAQIMNEKNAMIELEEKRMDQFDTRMRILEEKTDRLIVKLENLGISINTSEDDGKEQHNMVYDHIKRGTSV